MGTSVSSAGHTGDGRRSLRWQRAFNSVWNSGTFARLNGITQSVLVTLFFLANDDLLTSAGEDELIELVGLSRRSISRSTRELRTAGLVELASGGRSSFGRSYNVFRIVPPPSGGDCPTLLSQRRRIDAYSVSEGKSGSM